MNFDWSKVWAVAQTERRNNRRQVRYWVFLTIAYTFAALSYGFYGAIHAYFSSISATIGMISPRYLVGPIGFYYLIGFVLGIVFLGFDIRARDERDGIVAVLDSRPLTNLELVAGRFIAQFLSAWIPIVVLALLIQGFGWLMLLLGATWGRPVEPVSLFGFVFFLSIPGIVFAIGLVFFVTLLVRHRLVAALISVGIMAGMFWLFLTLPGPYAPYLDFLGGVQLSFPTDFIPAIAVPGGYMQRFAFIAAGLGLAGLAAAIHPRLDGNARLRPALGSAALVVVGVISMAVVGQMRAAELNRVEAWRAAHESRAGEPVADLISIDGSVAIDPGRSMDADLTVEVAAPAGESLTHVLLTLNPGLEVSSVAQDGQTLTTTHADGLLDIELNEPLAAGTRTRFQLVYQGRPDTTFGYLDSAIVTEELSMLEAQVVLLGYERGLFDRHYLALTPGIHWLPASGVDVGRDDPRVRSVDYFTTALEVELPESWLAAAPGRREELESAQGLSRFRFESDVALPEFALMASEFESFATEVRGITFEVLVHPDHDSNFEILANARGEVEQWIADRLDAAESAGLAYPLSAFTVVEVPNTLRGYEGGWRLDSAFAPPGMMLMRETSFPTARFDVDVFVPSRDPDQEGGEARVNRDRLISFFAGDVSGGNLFAGAARTFFAHRTAAVGSNAIAINFVLEQLSTLLLSGRREYFSAHLFTNVNQAATSIATAMQGQNIDSVVDAMTTAQTSRPGVWNTILDVALRDIDPWDDPQRTIDMLALKGGQLAEAIRDTLGPETGMRLLSLLIDRYAGTTFTNAEFMSAVAEISPDLETLITDWVGGTGLPGFVVRGVEQYRLPDDENGDARYQLLVRLSNDEPVVGFLRLSWTVAGGPNDVLVAIRGGIVNIDRVISAATAIGDPIRIEGRSAIEVGAVLRQPVDRITVEPYLSMNRDAFNAAQFGTARVESRDAEPFDGIREIPFDFEQDDRIIADDLDATFAIVTETGEDTFRLEGRGIADQVDLDQGLPLSAGFFPPEWSRRKLADAWGRYRHTLAHVRGGDGATRAVMPVRIPDAGLWELEIHLPPFANNSRGTWSLNIVSDNGSEEVSFDASVATNGWNLVGQYALPEGEVRVEISDRTEGRLVVADAIAWSPVSGGARSRVTNED